MASRSATAMTRAFSKWWDRRKVKHGNRFEADAGWRAGAQWALAEGARGLLDELTARESEAALEERRRCAEALLALARELER